MSPYGCHVNPPSAAGPSGETDGAFSGMRNRKYAPAVSSSAMSRLFSVRATPEMPCRTSSGRSGAWQPKQPSVRTILARKPRVRGLDSLGAGRVSHFRIAFLMSGQNIRSSAAHYGTWLSPLPGFGLGVAPRLLQQVTLKFL